MKISLIFVWSFDEVRFFAVFKSHKYAIRFSDLGHTDFNILMTEIVVI